MMSLGQACFACHTAIPVLTPHFFASWLLANTMPCRCSGSPQTEKVYCASQADIGIQRCVKGIRINMQNDPPHSNSIRNTNICSYIIDYKGLVLSSRKLCYMKLHSCNNCIQTIDKNSYLAINCHYLTYCNRN